MTFAGRELRSLISSEGKVTVSLEKVVVPDPADDEIIVRVEAAPINPSDIGVLLGSAEPATLVVDNHKPARLTFSTQPARLDEVRGRMGQSLGTGNEGAGVVVDAGRDALQMIGKTVGMSGGGMFADYRRIRAQDVMVLPDGLRAAAGASMFVNPFTALSFIETARRGGHKAIVHTAAASNLGQMLQRICLAEDIPLINIVRSAAQADELRAIGASRVLNSRDENFQARLLEEVAETRATVVFDPIGGGELGGAILQAMEAAAVAQMPVWSRYGSDTLKQLYIYGGLDTSPTVLDRRGLGYNWSVSTWLVMPFLKTLDAKTVATMRRRIVSELRTTFASRYTRVIGLADMLQRDIFLAYERKATGEKFLVDPTRG